MFINSENVRLKNFFLISDFLGKNGSSDRKTIAEGTSLSYITVTKAMEDLLDIGLITESKHGKSFYYALSSKLYFIVFTINSDSFLMTLCDISGTVKDRISYNPNDMYFYDENLSFFLKDSSVIMKRRHKNIKLIGASVLLPDDTSKFHGTKSILADKDRLSLLIKSYFNAPNVICIGESAACTLLNKDETNLIIRTDSCNAVCFRTDVTDPVPAILKSEDSSQISLTADGISAFAREIARAVGNVTLILRPTRLCFDGDHIFSIPTFKRTFVSSLSEFTCLREEDVPEIVVTNGDLPIFGCAAEIRRNFIKNSLLY